MVNGKGVERKRAGTKHKTHNTQKKKNTNNKKKKTRKKNTHQQTPKEKKKKKGVRVAGESLRATTGTKPSLRLVGEFQIKGESFLSILRKV